LCVPPKAQLRQTQITYHKRSRDAGPEQLRAVLGSIVLTGPRPSVDFFEDNPCERGDDRARD
jgi:hypothetical protein